MESALLLFPAPEGRRWLRFEHPVATVQADTIADVVPLLERADREAAAGNWAVFAITYDAAPAFDPALVAHHDDRFPYAVLGIFTEAKASFGPRLGAYEIGNLTPVMDASQHKAAVGRVKEYLRAGDSYQVNLTTRLDGSFTGDPQALFAGMVRAQGAAHSAFIDLGSHVLCSASPELLLSRHDDRLWTRPMKGTAARGADLEGDLANIAELQASEKERAENTMIVDMARNDLGRIADIGTVTVPNLHAVEHYPTVHQMVSLVEAQSSASLVEIFKAIYPAASITGAPKVRTSQIIAELESVPRTFYCGSLGAIAPSGRLECNVAIRTVLIDKAAGTLEYGVGGGIVWDSDPDREWAEIQAKSRVLDPEAPRYQLLETMSWSATPDTDRLQLHLDRLLVSASALGFNLDLDQVQDKLDAVRPTKPVRLRILVDWHGEVTIETGPLPPPIEGGWELPIDTHRVRSDDVFLQHKTTHRVVYERARRRFVDAPDVILVNERDQITETTIGNLIFDFDGRLLTPSIQCGLLAGTMRAELLQGGAVREAIITVERARQARRIWMVNAVRGWVPITLAPA